MLEFIVLGHIPGTNIYLSFMDCLTISTAISTLLIAPKLIAKAGSLRLKIKQTTIKTQTI